MEGNCCSNNLAGSIYGNNEDCIFRLNGISGILVFEQFQTESVSYDYLTINGVRYGGSTAPTGLLGAVASEISWHTDSSVARQGFKVCIIGCVNNCQAGSGCSFSSSSASCAVCPVGKWSSMDDKSECLECENGFTTANAGSTSASACSVCNTYLIGGGTSCGVLCTTSGIATCFAEAANSDELALSAGTLTSTDGINSWSRLTLMNKWLTISCSIGQVCTWKGASNDGVVYVKNNGGATTLAHIIIRDGHENFGAGLRVQNSICIAIVLTFINNRGFRGGAVNVDSGTAHFIGCSFESNTATSSGADIYRHRGTVTIAGCPVGFTETPGAALSNYGSSITGSAYAYHCELGTITPSSAPSSAPSSSPTSLPTSVPTSFPSSSPTSTPSNSPSSTPSSSPTSAPTIRICQPGEFLLDGTNCATCPDDNKITTTANQLSACSTCAGSLTASRDKSYCGPCEGGFGHTVNHTVCVPCTAGEFSQVTTFGHTFSLRNCTVCPRGHFQEDPQSSNCKPCPAGKYIDNEGSISILDCMSCQVSERSERALMKTSILAMDPAK